MAFRTLLFLAASLPSLVLAQESMCSVRTVVVPVVVTTTIGGPANTTTLSSGVSNGSNGVVVSTSTGGTVIPVAATSSSVTGGSVTASTTSSSTSTTPTLTLSTQPPGYAYAGSSVATSGSVVNVVQTVNAPPATTTATVTGTSTATVTSVQYAVSRAMLSACFGSTADVVVLRAPPRLRKPRLLVPYLLLL